MHSHPALRIPAKLVVNASDNLNVPLIGLCDKDGNITLWPSDIRRPVVKTHEVTAIAALPRHVYRLSHCNNLSETEKKMEDAERMHLMSDLAALYGEEYRIPARFCIGSEFELSPHEYLLMQMGRLATTKDAAVTDRYACKMNYAGYVGFEMTRTNAGVTFEWNTSHLLNGRTPHRVSDHYQAIIKEKILGWMAAPMRKLSFAELVKLRILSIPTAAVELPKRDGVMGAAAGVVVHPPSAPSFLGSSMFSAHVGAPMPAPSAPSLLGSSMFSAYLPMPAAGSVPTVVAAAGAIAGPPGGAPLSSLLFSGSSVRASAAAPDVAVSAAASVALPPRAVTL